MVRVMSTVQSYWYDEGMFPSGTANPLRASVAEHSVRMWVYFGPDYACVYVCYVINKPKSKILIVGIPPQLNCTTFHLDL